MRSTAYPSWANSIISFVLAFALVLSQFAFAVQFAKADDAAPATDSAPVVETPAPEAPVVEEPAPAEEPASADEPVDVPVPEEEPAPEAKLMSFASFAPEIDAVLPTIYQDNGLVAENCDETEWHWVITGLGDQDAPEEITVYFNSTPGGLVLPLEKKTGGTAHYRLPADFSQYDYLVDPGASAEFGGTYNRFNLSHGPCIVPLKVTKTAETSYDLEWTWDIEKSADTLALGELIDGQTATVNYIVSLSATSEEVNHTVSGTITITNPASNPAATVTSIVDTLDVSGAVVLACAPAAPVVLAPGASINCTYSESVDDKQDTLNTVVVTTVGEVPGSQATADVEWGDPETISDECVVVDDTSAKGPQEVEVCSDDLDSNGEWSDDYSVTFSKNLATDVVWACNQLEYANTASFISNDTPLAGSDTVTITGSIKCLCGLSQGYWFSKPGVVWPDTNGGAAGQLTIGGKNYTQAEGKAIWNSSNKSGITDAKKAFSQLAALKLSAAKQGLPIPASLSGYVATIEAFLASHAKLTGNNVTVKNAAVSAAADAISNWIGANHCIE